MKASLALIPMVGVMLLGTESFAANCTDSIPAPKYQVGDKFTWKYANGKERVWEITGLEGNLTEVKWSDGNSVWDSDKEGTYFFDQDRVIRKGVTKNGVVLLSPKPGAFSMIGIKDVDFPLQMGKAWNISYITGRFEPLRGPGNPIVFYSNLRVIGCEEVATLAGKFLALKIESVEGFLVPTSARGWGTIYRWYSPDAKNIVKVEFGRWIGDTTAVLNWSTPPINYELRNLVLR